jgi:hypothetical protein
VEHPAFPLKPFSNQRIHGPIILHGRQRAVDRLQQLLALVPHSASVRHLGHRLSNDDQTVPLAHPFQRRDVINQGDIGLPVLDRVEGLSRHSILNNGQICQTSRPLSPLSIPLCA